MKHSTLFSRFACSLNCSLNVVCVCMCFFSRLQLYAIIKWALWSSESEKRNEKVIFTINFNCILSVPTNFHENLNHQQQQQYCRTVFDGKDYDSVYYTFDENFTWFFNIHGREIKAMQSILFRSLSLWSISRNFGVCEFMRGAYKR